ncbi:hypothetical protein B2G50_13580 [Leptospira interrogans serovar Canicola]|nr:hypothetical protein B2G50_13580 [Leptospira interrogans serovar Canicola]
MKLRAYFKIVQCENSYKIELLESLQIAKCDLICRNYYIRVVENSIVEFNKTTSIDSFHTMEVDGELIFQQLYFIKNC